MKKYVKEYRGIKIYKIDPTESRSMLEKWCSVQYIATFCNTTIESYSIESIIASIENDYGNLIDSFKTMGLTDKQVVDKLNSEWAKGWPSIKK